MMSAGMKKNIPKPVVIRTPGLNSGEGLCSSLNKRDKMNKHKGCTKGFRQLSKCWYGEVNLRNSKYHDDITIGFYDLEGGGTSGEFTVHWITLAGRPVPRLNIFSDGWGALAKMPELINALSEMDSTDPSPDDFATTLESIGFKNLTETKDESKVQTNPLEKEVHDAYRFLRENNHTVSDEVLDLMKNSAIDYLNNH
jgi:hypothetical protein